MGFIRLIGRFSLFSFGSALTSALLHSCAGFQHILVNNNCKVTDHILVELECLLEFRDDVCRGFVQHLRVESGVLLVDCIREAPSPPTVNGRHLAAILRNEFLITSDNRLDLTVFQVGINNEGRFIFSLSDIQFNSPPLVISAARR